MRPFQPTKSTRSSESKYPGDTSGQTWLSRNIFNWAAPLVGIIVWLLLGLLNFFTSRKKGSQE